MALLRFLLGMVPVLQCLCLLIPGAVLSPVEDPNIGQCQTNSSYREGNCVEYCGCPFKICFASEPVLSCFCDEGYVLSPSQLNFETIIDNPSSFSPNCVPRNDCLKTGWNLFTGCKIFCDIF